MLLSLQAKQLDPEFGMDGDDDDGWDTALGYLDACGPGFHLQIARTTSIENNLANSSIRSSTSDLGTNILLDESQKEKVQPIPSRQTHTGPAAIEFLTLGIPAMKRVKCLAAA